ncbi:MAG: class I SAM-dependent methyltransferase [Euryarchaeota archaeon]|nr:class I SAM-dependent methyltransferase [Euryarchaeota archaeon]
MYKRKAAYFDSQVQAPWADEEYGPDEMDKLDRLFAETGPLDGLAILEPGCGTGRLTEILTRKVGANGHIVALDISPKMVKTARRRVASRQNVEVHLAEVEAFPLQESGFDLVLCHQVFPHFEDKEKALKILVSALKPGGKFIIFHFMNLSQINDLHRKAGTAVENDMMPGAEEMKHLFEVPGLKMEFLKDDAQGYFVSAKRFY